ncbi:hypothetical protein [Levilactobacillus senmaizukei]|uniref:hypothetical protein n=1 Tax=Levilactobacillus senmaizukei TaxID=431273 RepID=UPI00077B996C|nr:hypothetical protein [Levilactobacillus senmaizukei]
MKKAVVNLTLELDETNMITNFELESNLVEPDRRRVLLDAYIDLADKHGLGFADMGGELMVEAKNMQNGRHKDEFRTEDV